MSPALAGAVPERPAAVTTITVAMGQCAVVGRSTLLRSVGLGSCLAIVIFAPAQQLAALAHCMLPAAAVGEQGGEGKYVSTAVPLLLAALREAGAVEPFTATLVGGASMFPEMPHGLVRDIAAANVNAARTILADSAVPIRSEDVGGHIGRSVVVDPATQRVVVHTIRAGDRCL